MSVLSQVKSFDGFGPSHLMRRRKAPVEFLTSGDRKQDRHRLRELCPTAAGIYGMVDEQGTLIYVGKAKSLRHRLLSYLSSAADPKAQRIIGRARRVFWETQPDEFGALLRELELIRRWRPSYNVQGQPGRLRLSYVCVVRRPAPHVVLVAEPAASVLACHGPVPMRRGLRRAVELLSDCLRLRTCGPRTPIHFSEQQCLFSDQRLAQCIRFDLGTCLGPCAALCSAREYSLQVRAACDFLAGRDRRLLDDLQVLMEREAVQQQFERAAHYRDRWQSLMSLHRLLHTLRDVRNNYSFIYPSPGGRVWYLMRAGAVVRAIHRPHGVRAMQRAINVLTAIYGRRTNSATDQSPEQLDSTMLVAAWFQRHPEERQRTMSPADAKRLLIRRLKHLHPELGATGSVSAIGR